LQGYKTAMQIGELFWAIVMNREHFERKILGARFIDVADSIAFWYFRIAQ